MTTIPTIGFNVETIAMKGIDLTCWDVGGRGMIRPLLRHYYQNTSGVIFVVDSCDKDRFDDAFEELARCLMDDTIKSDIVCMILANKQDLPDAASCEEVEKRWNTKYVQLTKAMVEKRHLIFTRPCSVKTGDGLFAAFEEFALQLQSKDLSKSIDSLKEENNGLSMKTLFRDPKNFFKSLLMY